MEPIKIAPMSEDLVTLIMECAQNLPNENGEEIFNNLTAEASLLGKDGMLDSIDFVTLVVDVEQGIEDRYGVSIDLVDETAMSQRNSPYRTIGSLAEYAVRLIEGQSQAG